MEMDALIVPQKKNFKWLFKDRTDVKLYKYEIWYDSHNQELLSKVQKEMGTTNKNGVPFTVIGKKQ